MTPVASRRNLTPKKTVCAPRFLAAYRRSGNVSFSCKAAGITRETYYKWRETDQQFDAACKSAGEDSVDSLERVAWARARRGSDTLLIFLLKSLRPQRYRDRSVIEVKRFSGMSDDELDDYIEAELIQVVESGTGSTGLPALAAHSDDGE